MSTEVLRGARRRATAIAAAGWTVLAVVVVPAFALAQASQPAPRQDRGWGILWLVAAVLIGVALFRMFFGRAGRHTPPARRP